MLRSSHQIGAVLAVIAFALSGAAAQAADRYDRAFRWSGHRWTVRSTHNRADPGHNRWATRVAMYVCGATGRCA